MQIFYPAGHDDAEALVIATALEVYARICEARIAVGETSPYAAHLPVVDRLRKTYGGTDGPPITDPKLAKAAAALKRIAARCRSDAALLTEGMNKD